MKNQKTRTLVEAALLVAIATVLGYIKIEAIWANGGSITMASMAPLVILSLRHGWKWGLLGAVTFSGIQMLLGGVSQPPVQSFVWYLAVIMLDYVIAFSVCGIASVFKFGNGKVAVPLATTIVIALRLVCHVISGTIIWGVYAPEGVSPFIYSLTYNAGYMIPEIILTSVVVGILYPVLEKNFALAKATAKSA